MTTIAHDGQAVIPCVWVLAGVLSYRLCDRNYECEGCDLYHALRGNELQRQRPCAGLAPELGPRPERGTPQVVEEQVGRCLSWLTAGSKLYLDRYYTRGHFWLAPQDEDRVTLGLDDHVLRLLHPIDEIVAPRVGMRLRRGQPCGWVARRTLPIPLRTPLSGEVDAVNGRYLQTVRARAAPSNGDLWLLKLVADEPVAAAEGVCRGEDALALYLASIQRVKQYLRDALSPGAAPHLGLTLADGGPPQLDLEQILGSERYERLIHQTFDLEP